MKRIRIEGLAPSPANKDLVRPGTIRRVVNDLQRLALGLPYGDLAVRKGEKATRPPFSTTRIRNKLLAKGALDGLNLGARCILLGMVDAGWS